MNNNIYVSVIIPVYNAEKYIQQCVLSITSQSLKEIEVICVDDGSTDDSAGIINELIRTDSRIKYIYQENQGAPEARNNGLANSNGQYCMFFDSDDILSEDALKKMVNVIEEHNADLVIGNYREIDDNEQLVQEFKMNDFCVKQGKVIYENDEKYLCTKLPPLPGNKLFRKSVLIENGLEFYNLKIGQDLNFYLKFIPICSKICLLDESVFEYRIIDGSISRQYSLKILDICNCMADVKEHYIKHNKENFYKRYVSVVELIGYRSQLKKLKFFSDRSQGKEIYETLKNAQKNVSYTPSSFIKTYLKEKVKIYLILAKYRSLMKG